MSISLSDLPDCYVVVWSPREKRLLTEKFSDMVARNHHFYLAQQRSGVADWLVVGVARTAEGAAQIRMQAGQELSEHRHPTSLTREEQEAEDEVWQAAVADRKAGKPARPPKPPWWVSEE
jgi:hypothetical protein